MSTVNVQKKSATPADWHRADIIAALHKNGWSLRALSKQNNLNEGTLKHALDRPYKKAEGIIAAAIGLDPRAIWPSRYEKRDFKPTLPSSVTGRCVKRAAMN